MHRPINSAAAAWFRQATVSSLGLWLLAGSVLLLTGLLPVHSALLGWSLPFWLIVAPLLLTVSLAPGLPGRWLRHYRSRRRRVRASTWY